MTDKLEKLRARLKNKETSKEGPPAKKDNLQEKFRQYIDMVAPEGLEPNRAPAKIVDWTCPGCNKTYEMYSQDVPQYKCDSCLMRNR